MAIPESHRKNVNTLTRAANDGRLAAVECRRKSDGKIVTMICAVGNDDGAFTITPFAEMVDGNPFELYEPPSPEGGFRSGERPEPGETVLFYLSPGPLDDNIEVKGVVLRVTGEDDPLVDIESDLVDPESNSTNYTVPLTAVRRVRNGG